MKPVLQKMEQLQRIMDAGVIAVVRGDSPQQALETAEAVYWGGIDVIEITMTVPGAIKAMENIVSRFSRGEILLGAGTVLDAESARMAMLAGAEFIVSPNLQTEVVRSCNRYQKLHMAGCMTVGEIVAALEAGADIIKLFPGNLMKPAAVKAFKGPLPQAEFIPTGGVNLDNVGEWLQSGCLAVGVGGDLTKGAGQGDYEAVTEMARRYKEKINEYRQKEDS